MRCVVLCLQSLIPSDVVQSNVFVIGHKQAPLVTLPKNKGIKHGIIEEARRRAEKAAKN
jgi:hypothetical protein